MIIAALEGPSYSGKSTLQAHLRERLAFERIISLPCYVDAAGGSQNVPRAPAKNIEEQFRAFEFFLDLDQRRTSSGLETCPDPDIILMDRSVHTLLAHMFSVMKLFRWPVFERSCSIASQASRITWPNLILYIDAPQQILSSRYPPVISTEEMLFTDPKYNEGFKNYFIPRPRYTDTEMVVLDGQSKSDELVMVAETHIRAGRRDYSDTDI